jgi:hypothetical protein
MASFWDEPVAARLDRVRRIRGSRARGTAYEELVCSLFETVDGIALTERQTFNTRRSQEIDIAFWNDQHPNGFRFLPPVVLVECKNWMAPVTSAEVAWFDDKVRKRGLDFGILVAAHGITGDRRSLSDAHDIVARALAERRRLVVITSDELAGVVDGPSLVGLLKLKLTRLYVSGTSIK